MKYVSKFILPFCFILYLSSCSTSTDSSYTPPKPPVVIKKVIAPQYFWGTWICMADGTEITINEYNVCTEEESFKIKSATEDSLEVTSVGTFKKESSAVIKKDDIPYFRKGGANLNYSLKLVGFSNSGTDARTVSSNSVSGIKGTAHSEKYLSYKEESYSNSDGVIDFVAPVAGDVHTIELDFNNTTLVVPGVTISNNGNNMGTVPVVSDKDYVLKVTGNIDDSEKLDGYMYGNNYKSYPLTLTITNISGIDAAQSYCTISSDDENLSVTAVGTSKLEFPISTLKAGLTKTVELEVAYGNLTDGYVNTGLNIEITNGKTGQVWNDYVPLRFYRGYFPLTISASATESASFESKSDATLNGFIVYPDGNNQFFQIIDGDSQTILVPTFLNTENYMLSFSGATVDGKLSNSTEMFYTVNSGSVEPITVITTGKEAVINAFNYGENGGTRNETEDTAYYADAEFEAYISDGETDFFKISAKTDTVVSPSGSIACTVKFITSKGSPPAKLSVEEGTYLNYSDLPDLFATGYIFDGWYLNGVKFSSQEIKRSINLVAKWTPIEYSVIYNLNEGINSPDNPVIYTIEKEINFVAPSKYGYVFDGWYTDSVFSGTKVTGIGAGSTGNKVLYAKWIPIELNVTVSVSQLNDISVTQKIENGIITFTADNNFDSYEWTVDDESQSYYGNTFVMNTTELVSGTYEVVLLAKKGSDFRSATLFVKVD